MSDQQHLPAVLVNRFFVSAGAQIGRISFADETTTGTSVPRVAVAMSRDDLVALRDAIADVLVRSAAKPEPTTE